VAAVIIASGTVRPAALASEAALHFGTSLVYFQSAPAQLRAVQGGYGLSGLAGIAHFHEPEAARAPSFTVGDHADFLYIAVRTEQSSQLFFRRTVGQIADKKILHPIFSRCKSGSDSNAAAVAMSFRNMTGTDVTGGVVEVKVECCAIA
jgi:hypothetical protein